MRKVLWMMVALVATGCGPLYDSYDGDRTPRPMEYAFNRVKLILPEVSRENDPSTVKQTEYALGPNRNLLLNFKELPSHVSSIRTDGTHKVQARVTVLSDLAEAAASISFCPLIRHFMMMATWQNSHNFNTAGRWSRPGGDYDETGCVKGAVSADDPNVVLFDLTRWFIDYPRARGVNYGLVARSTKTVRIAGDSSGGGYPRFLWSE